MDVTKIWRQESQSPLNIFTSSVPSQQRHHREAVSKIVDPRPEPIRWTAHADLPLELIEGAMNVTGIQAVAPTGDEKVGGHCTHFPMLPPLGDVLGKH